MYEKRTYRERIRPENLKSFGVAVQETDLWICADRVLTDAATAQVFRVRGQIETYIRYHPGFMNTLVPWVVKGPAPPVIREMAEAGHRAGVGPMAAVAGAVASAVGTELLAFSDEVIVENGGDVFVMRNRSFIYSVYAGSAKLSMRFGIRLDGRGKPLGVCTSSGTIGHSYSTGKADAVCVVSPSCAVADAAATAICNQVTSASAIQAAIDFGREIQGVSAIVVIIGDKAGIWGDAEMVPLQNHG
jgi:ApbE superfamily uncharacterized protein (UPF0280 family)